MALHKQKLIRDYMKGKESDKRYELEKSFRKGFEKVLVVGSYCYEPVVIEATHACDITPSSLELLRKNNWKGDFRVCDVRNLCYSYKEFDCVFCCEVLEHLNNIEDVKKAISELIRVSKTWFISVPYKKSIPHDTQHIFFDERSLFDLLPDDAYISVRKPFMYATNDKERLEKI